MAKLCIISIVVVIMTGCGSGPGAENGTDSASTDSLTNPSYNPRIETDSGAKQMNLDSMNLKDSGRSKAPL